MLKVGYNLTKTKILSYDRSSASSAFTRALIYIFAPEYIFIPTDWQSEWKSHPKGFKKGIFYNS